MRPFLWINRKYRKGKQLMKKLRRGILQRKRYLHYVEKLPVRKNVILVESQQGRSFDGNAFFVAKALLLDPAFQDKTIYVSAAPEYRKKLAVFLKKRGLIAYRLVTRGTLAYFRVLATAGILVNDNTFIYCFIKRPEQVYLNTWHGTPLKTLGKSSKSEYYSIGNAQKTFLDADYVLYPNEFTMNHMTADYMVGEIGRFTPLLMGYPRNAIFFDGLARKSMRIKYGLSKMTAYAYLPTWRGTIGNVSDEEQEAKLITYLKELDQKLTDQQVLYVKMHTVSKTKLSFAGYRHIKPFPMEETYEFLNACDGCITDYSSILFDFANTGRKIILFPYDLAEYEEERGFYFPLSNLPFPQVFNTTDLAREISTEKNYDDSAFLKEFCAYDNVDAAEALCHHVFLSEKCGKEGVLSKNGKENVLIYGGDLALNGVTVALQNLLQKIDRTEKNYYLLIKTGEVRRNAFRLKELPEGISWLGITDSISLTLTDSLRFKLFSKKNKGSFEKNEALLQRLSKHEYDRVGARTDFSTVIHFNGYSNYITLLFSGFPCKKVIFSHSDMISEMRTRIHMRREILSFAYRSFDAVATVSEDILPSAKAVGALLPGMYHEPKLSVVRNVIDEQKIRSFGEKELSFDERTESTVPFEELQRILSSDAVKIINIGRFSGEKGHFRLMEQFAKLLPKYPDSYLIILGSRGALYGETKRRAEELNTNGHIIIIYYLSNPYALLRQCDAFAFTSFYEGFGLVLAEADLLHVPCFSTDVDGPKRFMERYGGTLVENSDKGVEKGLVLCLEHALPKQLQIDYNEYNMEAVESFRKLIS